MRVQWKFQQIEESLTQKLFLITGEKNFVSEQNENELFGIWKNRNDIENIEQFVRGLRKGRNI